MVDNSLLYSLKMTVLGFITLSILYLILSADKVANVVITSMVMIIVVALGIFLCRIVGEIVYTIYRILKESIR